MKESNFKLKGQKVITIPNMLSVVRILLIPLIVYLHVVAKNYVLCAVTLAVSYASDLADGIIARKFNMISDIGKLLDPLADKLTQATMLVCISIAHNFGWLLFALLFVKELLMAISGYLAVRRTGVVSGAKWFGKACTVILNSMFAIMLLIPTLSDTAFYTLTAICAAAMLTSMVAYVLFFTRFYEDKNAPENE